MAIPGSVAIQIFGQFIVLEAFRAQDSNCALPAETTGGPSS